MTIQEFIPTITFPVDVDRAYGPQCWDLAELYAEQNGVPKEPWAIPLGPQQAAYEAWTVWNAHMEKWFEKVAVSDLRPGDIVVDRPHPGGEEGHIYIRLANGLVFEQNANPDGSPPHIYARPLTYAYGGLRIKNQGGQVMAAETDGDPRFNDGDAFNIAKDFGSKNPDADRSAFNHAANWNDAYYGAVGIRIRQLVAERDAALAAADPKLLALAKALKDVVGS